MALNKNMKLEFSSAITNLTSKNSSFDSGTLRIAYTGKNRNGSFISKKTFESAIPTMFGVPVVANYIREIDEIGSHDGELVEKNGELEYVNITQPVGFVPPNANYWWEPIEDDGVIHQYLNTEVILWKRQEAYEKIKENTITKHSMEITVNDGEMQDDYYEIRDFEFTAFCLLGTAEPCFESSALFTFNKQELQAQFDEMLKQFKLEFSSYPEKKEGDNQMNKLQELLAKYNVAEENLGFDCSEMTDEELEKKFEEVFGENQDETIIDEPTVDEPADFSDEPIDNDEPELDADDVSTNDDFTLNSQIEEELRNAIRAERVEEEGYTYSRYWFVDFDVENNEIYFEDITDDWKLYGAPYSLDGDVVAVDFENKKRKKYAIIDYVEGTEPQNFSRGEIIDVIKLQAKQKYEELANKYEALITAQKKEEAEQLFAKFEEKLGDMSEFKLLKAEFAQYSIEELEERLFALVGRKQFKYTPKNNKSPKAPVDPMGIFKNDDTEYKPYGDIVIE